ncbi:DUF485 domain-containing protein [Pseudomonas sp. TE21394]
MQSQRACLQRRSLRVHEKRSMSSRTIILHDLLSGLRCFCEAKKHSQWRILDPRLWKKIIYPLLHGVNVNHVLDSLDAPRPSTTYQELVAKQQRLVSILTAAVLCPYAAFVIVAAFYPHLLAIKISTDSVINVAWPLGVFFVVGSWLLTGVYNSYANGELDRLTDKVREEAAS